MDEFNPQRTEADDEEYLDEEKSGEELDDEGDDLDDDGLDDEPFADEFDEDGELDDDDPEDDDVAAAAMPPEERLTGLVHYVAAKLVADPEQIEITAEQRGGTVYIGLRVPESDLGRVIGRGGRTAQAMRTLVSIAGSRHHLHARLDVDG